MLARTLLSIVTASAVALSPAAAGPALLFDAGDGKVLYAEDQDHQWHPASLTKIMTALLVFEAIREGKVTLETKIGCSELAHSQPPSKVGLPVGAEMTVEVALQALILKSANDVAVMLAEAVAGTHEAFVARMNATAQRLGMTRTVFANANGLPAPEQVTTARDLAKLTQAVLRDHSGYANMWAMVEMRVGKRRLRSHNALLNNYDGADGIKTGFICDSGFNIVASASRDGRRLVAVVLGEVTGRERSTRAANLLEHGFQAHGWKSMFGMESLDNLPVAADAKGVVSIRHAVVSWACGTGRRKVLARTKRKRPQAVAAKAGAAGPQKPDHGSPAVKTKAGVEAPQGQDKGAAAAKAKAKPKGEKTSATAP
ncbi:MAG: D-alanyl-D-alanine carboxypeptidase [Hyphomonadaceae bacterium]|jgi:D-alanyl-D-alanine carboxypeptidase|nr:D-alanyl-D-alanine carboxypeptidase [Hyphomonadaceae bacterium]